MSFPIGSADAYYQQLKKDNYHKSHHLHFSGKEPAISSIRPGIGGKKLPKQDEIVTNVFPIVNTASIQPQWVALDKVILRFYSYSYEGAIECREEEIMRIRYFEIHFFMEDETVMIMELRDDRAELRESKFMNRQRVSSEKHPDGFLSLRDMNVGHCITIHGRRHFIFKVDPFTRRSLTKMGIEVPENQIAPLSQHLLDAVSAHKMNQTLRRYISPHHELDRFLKLDTNVLRFYAYWDDREQLFGDRHFLVIHHYLGDETTEIVRKVPKAYGKEKLDPFIRRCKLAKNFLDYDKVNMGTPWPVLNIIQYNFKNKGHPRILYDQAQFDKSADIYQDIDFRTGTEINILARQVFLYDCDTFTRWYYKETYDYDQDPVNVEEPKEEASPIRPPPYNGYGSEEDSLGNCASLFPKPPKLDVRKYLLLEWDKDDTEKLMFNLKLASEVKSNKGRQFIMTYGMNEDSVFIYEKYVPAGMIPGRFHKKKAVKLFNDPVTDYPSYLQPQHLFVGGVFCFYEHAFVISNIDECTARFMEKHCDQFPFADYGLVRKKYWDLICPPKQGNITALNEALQAKVEHATGLVNWSCFIKVLVDCSKNGLNPHEYMTIARKHRSRNNISAESYRQLFRSLIQHYFRRNHFETKWNLRQALIKADPEARCYLSRTDFVRCLKAVQAPINYKVLDMYLDLVQSEDGNVCYLDLVHDLDWLENSGKKITDIPQNVTPDYDYEKYFGILVPLIRYENFICELRTIPET